MKNLFMVDGHRLNQDGTPGSEYIPRLEKTLSQYEASVDHILLMAGKATLGVDKKHGDAGEEYLMSKGVDERDISKELDTHGSLDTVGELVLARNEHEQMLIQARKLVLVSSDYHEKRMLTIAEFILGKELFKKVDFIGIPRHEHNSTRTMDEELRSLASFKSTFAGVPLGNIDLITKRLWQVHPLYKMHPSNPYKTESS